jgi:hypothetical protein
MLENMTPKPRGEQKCKMGSLRDGLDKSDQKILDECLANREDWPADLLVRELRKNGLNVGRNTIRAHRRGDCICVTK